MPAPMPKGNLIYTITLKQGIGMTADGVFIASDRRGVVRILESLFLIGGDRITIEVSHTGEPSPTVN